jgi:hypothetical protein
MAEFLSPGGAITEIDSPNVLTSLPFDINGLLGVSEKGPVNKPTSLFSYTDFVNTFGKSVNGSTTSDSVLAFFKLAGAGSHLIFNRVVHYTSGVKDSLQASVDLFDDGDTCLKVNAYSDGTWGNRLRVRTKRTNLNNGFVSQIAGGYALSDGDTDIILNSTSGLVRGSVLAIIHGTTIVRVVVDAVEGNNVIFKDPLDLSTVDDIKFLVIPQGSKVIEEFFELEIFNGDTLVDRYNNLSMESDNTSGYFVNRLDLLSKVVRYVSAEDLNSTTSYPNDRRPVDNIKKYSLLATFPSSMPIVTLNVTPGDGSLFTTGDSIRLDHSPVLSGDYVLGEVLSSTSNTVTVVKNPTVGLYIPSGYAIGSILTNLTTPATTLLTSAYTLPANTTSISAAAIPNFNTLLSKIITIFDPVSSNKVTVTASTLSGITYTLSTGFIPSGIFASSSAFIYLSDSFGNPLDSELLPPVKLIGGVDGLVGLSTSDFIGDSSLQTGLYAFDSVPVLNRLAYNHNQDIKTVALDTALVNYCANRRFTLGILTSKSSLSVASDFACNTVKEYVVQQLGVNTKHAFFVFNESNVFDSQTNGKKTISSDGVVLGLFSRVAKNYGLGQAPAGDVALVSDSVLSFQNTNVNSRSARDNLYPVHINVLADVSGIGRCLYGSRTLLRSGLLGLQVNEAQVYMHIEQTILEQTHWIDFKNKNYVESNLTPFISDFLDKQIERGHIVSYYVNYYDTLQDNKVARVIGIKVPSTVEFYEFFFTRDTRSLESELRG